MPELSFVHHPARRQPLGTLAVLLVLVLIGVATWSAFHDAGMTGVMLALYVGYMASFLWPSAYRIDATGIALGRLGMQHRFVWHRFRSFSLQRGGVYLARSRARGVFLVMDRAQQVQVKPYLEAHIHG